MISVLTKKEPWRVHAACIGEPPGTFYHDEDDWAPYTRARELCGGCPVRPECLHAVLEAEDDHGFRGGKSPRELRVMIRQRRRMHRVLEGACMCSSPRCTCRSEATERRYARA